MKIAINGTVDSDIKYTVEFLVRTLRTRVAGISDVVLIDFSAVLRDACNQQALKLGIDIDCIQDAEARSACIKEMAATLKKAEGECFWLKAAEPILAKAEELGSTAIVIVGSPALTMEACHTELRWLKERGFTRAQIASYDAKTCTRIVSPAGKENATVGYVWHCYGDCNFLAETQAKAAFIDRIEKMLCKIAGEDALAPRVTPENAAPVDAEALAQAEKEYEEMEARFNPMEPEESDDSYNAEYLPMDPDVEAALTGKN